MRISKLPVYISFVLATLVFAQLAAGQQVSVANVITGKVVDKNGRAIEGAWVIDTVDDPNLAVDQLLIGSMTDSDGRFRIEYTWKAGKRVYLEVKTPSRAFTYYPIVPPYTFPQIENYPSLISIPIEISGKPTRDVGTITMDPHLPSVKLKLFDQESKKPLDLELLDNESSLVFFGPNRQWMQSSPIISVRNAGAISFDNEEITIGLPAGEWKIALCKDDECKTSFGETKRFRVTSSEKEKIVVLEVDP